MFKSYLKTAVRFLLKNKAYSILNILGLATGMAVSLLIGLWVHYQYSYNRFLPNYQQIYQVRLRLTLNGEIQTMPAVALPLASVLKKDIPGIKYVAETDWMTSHSLMAGEKKLLLAGAQAGPDFLQIFQYPLLKGTASAVLKDPYSIVLTQSIARSLFGKEYPINKIVRVDNAHDMKVTGVLKDLPENSTFQFKFIIPFSYWEQNTQWVKKARTTWNNSFQLFVALQAGTSYTQVEAKLKNIMHKYNAEAYKTTHAQVFMQPLKDWHLYTEFKNGSASGGFIDYVRMFGITGIFVLLIACINFTNLSTACSEKRAREVGIRKVAGSLRRELISQFLIESVMIAFIAFAFSILFVQLALPAFNALTGTVVTIPWFSGVFWGIMISYVVITGLLAGSRPAFYLSAFNPVKVLKGTVQTGKLTALPANILVVLQFTCSVALIISTIVIYQQIEYAKERPLGYDASRLMLTDAGGDANRNFDALKNDVLKTGMVESITKASNPVTGIYSFSKVDDWQGKYPNETLNIANIAVSADYFKTLGMQLKAGSDFKGNIAADSLSVILNEAAVKRLRLNNPVNQVITWHNKQQHIVVTGVVKDALMESPFAPAQPTFFIYNPQWVGSIMYRLSPSANVHEAITKLEPVFNKYNPSTPYNYQFADESYLGKFTVETLIGRLAGVFATLAIFISCLGLFGLAAYIARHRIKEIGIRKILGASVPELWMLLSKKILLLVLLSCAVASPVAWYFLHGWLQNYDYRITIQSVVFIWATVAALCIAVFTISYQAIRATLANPVKALRAP